jgi:UV DNA damage repair endonuclease
MWIKVNDDFFNLNLVEKITIRKFDENSYSLRFTFTDGEFIQVMADSQTIKSFIKTMETHLKPIAKFKIEESKPVLKNE